MSITDKAEVCLDCLEYTVKLNHGITQENIAAVEAQNLALMAAIDSNDDLTD